ncbi:MAG: hypothetical protein AAFO87_15305 [Cyanobacteria bacterium J06607_6]
MQDLSLRVFVAPDLSHGGLGNRRYEGVISRRDERAIATRPGDILSLRRRVSGVWS